MEDHQNATSLQKYIRYAINSMIFFLEGVVESTFIKEKQSFLLHFIRIQLGSVGSSKSKRYGEIRRFFKNLGSYRSIVDLYRYILAH